MNTDAQRLGRLGRGKKKTMSRAAMAQRRRASKLGVRARLKVKPKRGRKRRQIRSRTEIVREAWEKLALMGPF